MSSQPDDYAYQDDLVHRPEQSNVPNPDSDEQEQQFIEFNFDSWLEDHPVEGMDPVQDEWNESSDLFQSSNDTLANFEYPNNPSSLNFDMNAEYAPGPGWLSDNYQLILDQNPYRPEYQNPYQPGYQNPYQFGYQHPAQNISDFQEIPGSFYPPVVDPYVSGALNASPSFPIEYPFSGPMAGDTLGVASNNAFSKPEIPKPRKIRSDKGTKRQPRGTGNRDRSESTVQGDRALGTAPMKRTRSPEDEEESLTDCDPLQQSSRHKRRLIEEPTDRKFEWNESIRPKYFRNSGNENARYRHMRRHEEQKAQNAMKGKGPGSVRPRARCPEGVSTLFTHLKSNVTPKKHYYQRRSRSEATMPSVPEGQSVPPTVDSEKPSSASGTAGTATEIKKPRQLNPRQHVGVGVVRETAPEGWDRFDNEFYSGDDNISDDDLELPGKATDYKPPRMACRRCNKLKQPCDHKYPSCSLCEKYGQRCRYRDSLTGRQIKPGQLEEIEDAYQAAKKEIKRLKEELEDAQRQLDASKGSSSCSQTYPLLFDG